MKRVFKIIARTLKIVLFSVPFFSCGGGEDEPELSGDYTQLANYSQFSYYYDKLANTTWALVDARRPDGEQYVGLEEYLGQTLTFTGEIVWDDCLKLKSSLFPTGGYGLWRIEDSGNLFFTPNGGTYPLNAWQSGEFLGIMGMGGEIVELNDRILVCRRFYDGRYSEYTYEAATHYDDPDSPGDEPGGSSGYEKPDIGFYDFTCYGTSTIKVQFVINNPDEAAVSSAKVYYGKSSPSKSVTAEIVGKMIIARISGLEAGTEYEVKCKATGKGGTSISDTYLVATNY